MVFSSLVFLFLFLPIVLAVYFLLRNSAFRNVFLLLASLLFYAWGEPSYVWVMLVSIVANYFLAIWIEDHRSSGKQIVSLAVIFNVGLLAYFKYCNFFVANVNQVLGALNQPAANVSFVPLPLGVSFFTFHALSYVIDVFRKQAVAQRRPMDLALYICFFPQLIAGPIIRYHEICQQLVTRTVSPDLFSEGIKRFIGGLGKKVLIANIVAKPCDLLFGLPPSELSLSVSWLAAVLYALQVYFDFAGYSDMAIGLGLMFGFHFPENFNYPYVAQSMRELWNRWHISLSNWFRDYLFKPIGGFRRNGKLHSAFLLMVIFFCVGLWHGASWHFVLWGVYNGLFVSFERFGWGKLIDSAWRPFRHLYVVVAWLFGAVMFRSESVGQALTIWGNMLGFNHNVEGFYTFPVVLNYEISLAMIVGILACTPLFKILLSPDESDQRILAGNWLLNKWKALNAVPQLTLEATVLLLVVFELVSGAYNPFIYFRF